MTAALLATLFFALSSVSARRAVRHFGSNNANLGRISLATVGLALNAHLAGAGFRGPGLGWFLASGVVGFGICDTALYLALPRLGAPLAALMTQCLAAPIAAAAEWAAWGGTMKPLQLLGAAVALTGVAVALSPWAGNRWRDFDRTGILLGVVAAAGQGLGAAMSRHGSLLCLASGFHIDGLSVTYQRILPGLVFAAFWRVLAGPGRSPADKPGPLAAGVPWLAGAALCGPTLGVASYQWALQTMPAGVVTAVAALTPLAVAPLSWWLEKERPPARLILGGMVAAAGVALLALGRN
jgi:drug/metabolite transporter (DMT)-like permease